MAHGVPLTKQVLVDLDLCPYLAAFLAALYMAGDSIRLPKKGNIIELKEKELEDFPANKGAKIYDKYRTLARDYRLHTMPREPAN